MIHRIMTVDPGQVSGCGLAVVSEDALLSFQVDEVSGGLTGLAHWIERQGGFHRERGYDVDLVVVEDFIINESTWQKTRDEAVLPATDGLGHTKAVAILADAKLEVVGPSGHKTFNQETPAGKPSKVQMLNLAPRTPDGHAEDTASLLLIGLKRHYPKVLASLLRRLV